jgi:hypothetical protein
MYFWHLGLFISNFAVGIDRTQGKEGRENTISFAGDNHHGSNAEFQRLCLQMHLQKECVLLMHNGKVVNANGTLIK